MDNVSEYLLLGTCITLLGKIIFDWLKNRGGRNAVKQSDCIQYREEIYNRLDRIEEKIDKIILYLGKIKL